MGCFIACFTTSKNRKSPKLQDKLSSANQRQEPHEALQPTNPINQDSIHNPSNLITEPKYEHEEQLDRSTKKKVTFDLNVKTHKELSSQETQCCLVEIDEERDRGNKEETRTESQTLLGSNVSSMAYDPPNHRYHNCTSNDDDECEDMDLEESDSDGPPHGDENDDSDQALVLQEESSESLFSISIGKQSSAAEMGSKEVNSPITIPDSLDEESNSVGLNQRSGRNKKSQQQVLSVLSPVENLTQWKVVKAKTTPSVEHHQDKENMTNIEHELNISSSEEPSFKLQIHNSKRQSKHLKKPETREIAVDTSFSSWLVECGMVETAQDSLNSIGTSSPERANSAASFEDRPILGAMTVEELKKLSEFSSPRRSSPRHSPDEIPIIGTVGSYWSHTGHTVDSDSSSSSRGMSYTSNKYREEKSVKWQSPFETRLERALDSGVAQV